MLFGSHIYFELIFRIYFELIFRIRFELFLQRELQIRYERGRSEFLEQQADFRLQVGNVHELELVDGAVDPKQLAVGQVDAVEVLQYESIDVLLALDVGSRQKKLQDRHGRFCDIFDNT